MNERTTDICTRARDEIHRLGITQKMIADESGVSIHTVRKQFQGEYPISLEVMASICRISSQCDVRYILVGLRNDLTIESLGTRISNIERLLQTI